MDLSTTVPILLSANVEVWQTNNKENTFIKGKTEADGTFYLGEFYPTDQRPFFSGIVDSEGYESYTFDQVLAVSNYIPISLKKSSSRRGSKLGFFGLF